MTREPMAGLAVHLTPASQSVTDNDTAGLWIGGRMPGGPDAEPQAPLLHLRLSPLSTEQLSAELSADAWVGQAIGAPCAAPGDDVGAVLCNLMNIPPSHEEEFNAWYDTEHMPRLSALPGVICAGRFKALQGDPVYAAFYFLADRSVCQSALWRETAQTPWTVRIQQYRTDNRRLAFVPLNKT